jgi:hypothetical protein
LHLRHHRLLPRGVGANIPPELAAPAAGDTAHPGPATPGAAPPASRQASRDAFLSAGHGERPPVRESPPSPSSPPGPSHDRVDPRHLRPRHPPPDPRRRGPSQVELRPAANPSTSPLRA